MSKLEKLKKMSENKKLFLINAYRRLCLQKKRLGLKKQKLDQIVDLLKQCSADLNCAVDLYIKELQEENPIVFLVTKYYSQSGKTQNDSIWRTIEEANLEINRCHEDDEGDDVYKILAQTPIHLIDVTPRSKVLDMAIREMNL